MRPEYETRVGIGFDVHKFKEDTAARTEHIILCGVEVPFNRLLQGHSDADVMLHAITDALLGAMGAGDIGQHFPPSDERYKGISSRIFVEYCADELRKWGGRINNIDVTLIGEEPKIAKYTDDMKLSVSDMLALSPSRINIKATTTEGLGFTGRREGLAAQAVATIELPLVR